MEKARMPFAAGFIIVVAGILGLFRYLVMFAVAKLVLPVLEGFSSVVPYIVVNVAVPALIVGIVFALLAIAAGMYTLLNRKIWGLALIGSIAAVFCSVPLGIAAVVLVAISRKQFL